MGITTAEAATLATERGYPVKVRTVKQWCLRGHFPTTQIGTGKGSRWLIDREGFEAFLETRTAPPKGGREGE